jgi:hypothetical protein
VWVEGSGRGSMVFCADAHVERDGDGHENILGWRWTAWRLDEGSHANGLGFV